METIHSFLIQYGYLGIFLIMALGIFGPPVADELIIMFLGYLVCKSHLEAIPTLAAVVCGSVSGITLDYLLGRSLGHYLLHRPDSWLHRRYQRVYQVRLWLARTGAWALSASYFVPGLRHCAPMVAGLSELGFTQFALSSFPGGLLWGLGYIALGYLLGERWNQELLQSHYWLIIFGVLASLGLAYRFWRKRMAWT